MTVQAPTEFHSKISERVFRAKSDLILGMFSLDGIAGKSFLRIDGELGTTDGKTNNVSCERVQVLGTIRFPQDTWIPFYGSWELKNGGMRYDSTGITVLRGTWISFK